MSTRAPDPQRLAKGWHTVAGEPPGTLAWWDGHDFVVMALWANDHWEYVSDTWASAKLPPGLPGGVADPRALGWRQGPDEQWRPPPPSSQQGFRHGTTQGSPAKTALAVSVTLVGCLGAIVLGVLAVGLIILAFAFSDFADSKRPSLDQWSLEITTTTASTSAACGEVRLGRVPAGQPAHLAGCDLTDATLADLDLSHADLRGARLDRSSLYRTNLSGSDLTGASLDHANLTQANLSGATLASATLRGVAWSSTTCPDGSNSDAHANTCIGYGI